MQTLATWFQASVSPFSVWQGIFIVVATWLVTGGAVYGILKTTVNSHGVRIDAIEDDIKNRTVSRREFDDRHTDNVKHMERLENQGQRIEDKINALFERRARPRD